MPVCLGYVFGKNGNQLSTEDAFFLKDVYSLVPRYSSFLNTSNFFSYHWPFTTMIDISTKTNSYLTIIKKKPFKTSLEEWLTLYK